MAGETNRVLIMRDVVDFELITADGRSIGRVADVEADCGHDGQLVLTHLLTGPEALAGRVSTRLRPIARLIFRGRFDHRIPMREVDRVEMAVHLRGPAVDYAPGRSERWLAETIVRHIPGSRR